MRRNRKDIILLDTYVCVIQRKGEDMGKEKIPVLVSQAMDITKMPGKGKVNRIFVVVSSYFISSLIGKTGNRSMQIDS